MNTLNKTYHRVKDLMRLWTIENGSEVELTDENSILVGTLKCDYKGMLDDYPVERLDRVEYRLPLSIFNKLNEEEKRYIFEEVAKEIKTQIKMAEKYIKNLTEHLKNLNPEEKNKESEEIQ